MGFQFSLENVYLLRKSLETQAEQRLSQATQEVVRARLALDQLDLNFTENQRDWLAAFSGENLAPALHFGLACESSFALARRAALEKLTAAHKRRQQQLQSYREARQKREILGNLRVRHLQLFDLELSRRQQQSVDELFLLRNFLISTEPNLPSD
jgi:flagellar biosynthesis chaperone FliJ